MHRAVANKNGTIEVNGDIFRFLQPADELKTDDLVEIEKSYRSKMDTISDDPQFITADNIDMQNGQVVFEYSVKDLKMFDYLRTLFLQEKLSYFSSLIEIAKREDVNVLWQKENFAVDPYDQTIKCMVVEHDVFPLFEQKDKTAAVKELIILSLTSLNHVYGKPRRSDFLEQNEDVIQFAEKVYLKAKMLEEIEGYINTEMYHLDMQKREEAESQQKGGQFKKIFASKKGKKAEEENRNSMVTKLKTGEDEVAASSEDKNKANKKGSNKKLFIGLGGAILCALLLSAFLQNATDNAKEASSKTEEEPKASEETKQMLSIYRDSFFEDTESTISKLEKIGYDQLKKNDQRILNHLYVKVGDYDEAIQHNPELAGEVAEKLYQEERLKQLEDLNASLKEPNDKVSFYIAMLQEDWESIIALYESLSLNEEMKNAVLTAYFHQGDVNEAEKFVYDLKTPSEKIQKRMKDALEIQEDIYNAENKITQLKKQLEDTDKKKKEDISKEIKKQQQKVEELRSKLTSV